MRKFRFIIACLVGLFGGSLWCHAGPIADTLHTTFVNKTNFIPLHVVTITAGGGLHALLPTLTEEGKNTSGLRATLGAGTQIQGTYTFFFHKYVGVTAGVGFNLATAGMRGNFSNRTYLYSEDNAMYYWLNCDYYNFHESEQLYMFEVPVGVTGRVSLTDRWMLRGSVGLGMNIVVGSHFKGDGELDTSSDWPDLNLHIDPDLPQHGFSHFFMGGYKGSFGNTYPLNMFVFADFAAHYQYTKRIGFYAGVYFSYNCFSNIRPQLDAAGNMPELVYFDNRSRQYTYGGMVNSKFIQSITPLSVGLKFGITLTWLDPVKCNCEDR